VAKLIYGERIGRLGATLVGGSCGVLNADRTEILLTRRSDNGRWCLPGGHFEPGEAISETAVRETKEETGLDVEIVRLVGVYSDPNRLLEYADGNQFQIVAVHFEGRVVGGELTLSDELAEARWFTLDRLPDWRPDVPVARAFADLIRAEGAAVT
jgi:ADP-ribose pyrophosphatase YjhB (NUDIX family)